MEARSMRIAHAALTAGLTLAGVVFVVVRRVQPPPALAQGPLIGTALTVAAIGAMAVALTVARSRVPAQASDETADGYWGTPAVRGAAIVLWAVAEGAGMMAAVGYLLTGTTAPLIALVLAILTLASLRPGRFERDEA